MHDDSLHPFQLDFLQKSVSIMKVLSKEALRTAERFTKACGRKCVTGNDMYYALMYEAHEFFDKDFENEYLRELEEEKTHTYETDEEEEGEDEESGEESEEGKEEKNDEEENREPYSIECETDFEFHSKVIHYANGWRDWCPDDPVKMLIKNAVDKTQDSHGGLM